jgi:hypothetical protein
MDVASPGNDEATHLCEALDHERVPVPGFSPSLTWIRAYQAGLVTETDVLEAAQEELDLR